MRFALTCWLIWCLTVAPASAWNFTGHKVIASIAFQRLTAEEQGKVVAALRRHPRFAQDFAEAMPAEIQNANETTQNEWFFQQAAVWPDMIRSGSPERKAFGRGEWHYVNVPLFLSDSARAELAGKLTVNVATEPPEGANLDTPSMNVTQAINLGRRVVKDRQASPADRAVMLAWLVHCVGDVHQPLHGAAMFSIKLFPEGDRGGNSVKTKQNGNLHALWDGLLGRDDEFRAARNAALKLAANEELSRLGKESQSVLDQVTWRDESHHLAAANVYTTEVIDALRKMEAAGSVAEISLSEDYLKSGGRIAERRVVQAGFRLGELLKSLVD
ncbi:MAG TPA: S1/P1 nuclease [Pirellulaceae bacterium]|jgi:hypothetical protein